MASLSLEYKNKHYQRKPIGCWEYGIIAPPPANIAEFDGNYTYTFSDGSELHILKFQTAVCISVNGKIGQ